MFTLYCEAVFYNEYYSFLWELTGTAELAMEPVERLLLRATVKNVDRILLGFNVISEAHHSRARFAASKSTATKTAIRITAMSHADSRSGRRSLTQEGLRPSTDTIICEPPHVPCRDRPRARLTQSVVPPFFTRG